jgi:hypothetical protein
VATYLVEFFVPRTHRASVTDAVARARAASAALRAAGTPIRLLHAVVEPASELCLCFFEAETSDVVLEGTRRAGLPFDGLPEEVEFVACSYVDEKQREEQQ